MTTFLIIAIIILAILIAFTLFYANGLNKRVKEERAAMNMFDRAFLTMYSKTVNVDLTNDTYILKTQGDKTEQEYKKKTGYDQFVTRSAESIKDKSQHKRYMDMMTRKALLKAYTEGDRHLVETFNMEGADGKVRRIVVEVYIIGNESGSINAFVLYHDNTPSNTEEKLKNTLQIQATAIEQHQLREMELIQKEKEHLKHERALSDLLEEKYMQLAELEEKLDDMKEIYEPELELEPQDVRKTIKDILPTIREHAGQAGLDFALKIEHVAYPYIYCDANCLNAMILNIIFNAIRNSVEDSKIIFCITQTTPVVDEIAEYEYSCIYLGESVKFDGEIANEMGGIVNVERTDDGAAVISVRIKFKVYVETEPVTETEDEDE